MDVQSQLLFYWEFCQNIKIRVAERERVRGLGKITSTPEGVPLPSYR
ncbi:hypothetical protein J568_3801, partial [Acinetobacter baumannii 6112]